MNSLTISSNLSLIKKNISGVRDILVKSDANESRKKIMQTTRQVGRESAADGVGLFKDGQIPDEEDLDKALESAHR